MKVFVTRKIPFWDEVSKPLKDAGHEVVVYHKNQRMERQELIDELRKGYDGLLCLLTDKIDPEIIAADDKKQLKIIANYAVGFDNINLEAAASRNIIVTNTPCDEVNEAVAELTWTLMLALSRNLEPAADFAKNVGYHGWEPDIFLGSNMHAKTLGIVGMGRIGGMVAKRAVGFGVGVIYYNHKPVEGVDFEFKASLEELLKQSDFVSLHVPLNKDTLHLINSQTLSMMKPNSFLINTARGPVVEEGDLFEALKMGKIAGAALDVWENEPQPRPELVEMQNVILTPHIASATRESRLGMGKVAIANLLAVFSGKEAPNLVKLS